MALPDLPETSDAPEGEYVATPDTSPEAAADERPNTSASPKPREAIDTRLVRRLADILKDTDLSEIEVEKGDLKIRVARQTAVALAAPLAVAAPMVAPPSSVAAAASAAAPEVKLNEELSGEIVKSPMVGAVYLQATPGAKQFIQPGEQVTAGQTLLIIEAMKTMNPVPSPKAGTVVKVLVEDGQPVEFGEPLVIID